MKSSMIYVHGEPGDSNQGGSNLENLTRIKTNQVTSSNSKVVDLELSVVGGGMDSSQSLTASASNKQIAVTDISDSEIEPDSSVRRARAEYYFAISLIVLFVAIFILGRFYYDERYYVPEEGLGYWLGLVGGVMMLLAFCYTAFKYAKVLRSRAVMRHWLTIHIFFGVAGPLLILLHSTFTIGSLNGGIALISMILVFVSGVMARFIYAKTHYGLDGSVGQVKDIKNEIEMAGLKIKSKSLDVFTEKVLKHQEYFLYALWDWFTFGWRSRWLYFRLTESMHNQLKAMQEANNWDNTAVEVRLEEFKQKLRTYISMLNKVTLFGVYERFFAFWRNAHVPLLYLLLMSSIVHVLAVHMY